MFRLDQETGDIQEIRDWDISPFDFAYGYIYGYDRNVKDIVRMPLQELV